MGDSVRGRDRNGWAARAVPLWGLKHRSGRGLETGGSCAQRASPLRAVSIKMGHYDKWGAPSPQKYVSLAGRDAAQETGWRLMEHNEAGSAAPLPPALSEAFL